MHANFPSHLQQKRQLERNTASIAYGCTMLRKFHEVSQAFSRVTDKYSIYKHVSGEPFLRKCLKLCPYTTTSKCSTLSFCHSKAISPHLGSFTYILNIRDIVLLFLKINLSYAPKRCTTPPQNYTVHDYMHESITVCILFLAAAPGG